LILRNPTSPDSISTILLQNSDNQIRDINRNPSSKSQVRNRGRNHPDSANGCTGMLSQPRRFVPVRSDWAAERSGFELPVPLVSY
jgi:hypothetical protein